MTEVAPWDSQPPTVAANETAPWDSAPPETATPKSPTTQSEPEETAGRVTGLGARALVQGIGHLADTPGALVNLSNRAGLSIENYTRHLLGLPLDQGEPYTLPPAYSQLAEHGADAAGLPKPETAGERIGSKAVEALPTAALVPEAPVAGALSAMAGGAGSQYAAEQGASPAVQFATGLAAGSLPAATAATAGAATRALVRGGAEGRTAMNARLTDAAQSNTPLTLGQASGSTPLQYLEGTASKLPGGSPLKSMPAEQGTALGDHVNRIVENLSGPAKPSPMTAGSAITSGIESMKKTMRAAEEAADAKQDSLIPQGTQADVSGVLATLDKHASPVPGAEAITSVVSPKIAALRDQVKKAVAANSPPSVMGSAPSTLPYDAVAALKSKVGNMVDWGFAPANPMENGQLKDLWGSLAEAKTQAAMKVSPESAKAASDFNKLYAANQKTRDALNSVINANGGPEAVYQAATNATKAGATKISQVMKALQPEQQNLVRATVLDKMGRASGAQDSPFNPSTFLTNWTKIDPSAKDALFGASGSPKSLRDGLDSVTNTMSAIRQGTKLQNWSGTGEAAGHIAGYAAALDGLREAIGGNWHVAAGVASGMTANNLLSRALTNPNVINWFARATKAPVSALPNAVNQLAAMGRNDPDARDMAEYFKSQDRPARAAGGRVTDIDTLVNRLMTRWKQVKRQTNEGTKPLLNLPDSAVARALETAQESI